MSLSNNGWTECLEPEKKGLIPGTKVHLTECLSCEMTDCPLKGELFYTFFPVWVDLESSPLNKKIMELNESLANRKRKKHQLYCPKKKVASIGCSGKNSFCRYNVICGRYKIRTGTSFIKSIRWRKAMIYVVMYLDGTSEVVNRSDFASVDIDRVERVYPGSYEVRIVSELVPLGEEKEKLEETIETFSRKYKGGVVTSGGLVNFDEWFMNGTNGDTAVIPEKVLVPQKTYKVVKIRDNVSISDSKGAAKIDKIPEKKEVSETKIEKTPEKKDQPENVKSAKSQSKKSGRDDDKQMPIFESEKKDAEVPKKTGKTVKKLAAKKKQS